MSVSGGSTVENHQAYAGDTRDPDLVPYITQASLLKADMFGQMRYLSYLQDIHLFFIVTGLIGGTVNNYRTTILLHVKRKMKIIEFDSGKKLNNLIMVKVWP